MALGKSGGSQAMDLMVLSLKQKKEGKPVPPHFAVKKKNEDSNKWEVVDETDSVTGSIEKIEVETKEFEGTEYKAAKITISDSKEGEIYLLDLKFTYLSRSLFNSLYSLENFGKVNISLYETKRKSDGKVFANVALRDLTKPKEENLVRWAFEREEIPEVEKMYNKKKEYVGSDSSDVDEFFEEKLNELAERVKNQKGQAPQEKTDGKDEPSPDAASKEDDVSFDAAAGAGDEDDGDDVPF